MFKPGSVVTCCRSLYIAPPIEFVLNYFIIIVIIVVIIMQFRDGHGGSHCQFIFHWSNLSQSPRVPAVVYIYLLSNAAPTHTPVIIVI